MELRPSLHLSVVAIEKGAFESPTTTVEYTHTHTHIYVYIIEKSKVIKSNYQNKEKIYRYPSIGIIEWTVTL